jgi:hypothetical protein
MADRQLRHFRTFVRGWSIASVILFSSLLVAFTIRLSLIDDGGVLHWAIWDEVTGHVGPMLFVVYIVWAIYLFKAPTTRGHTRFSSISRCGRTWRMAF